METTNKTEHRTCRRCKYWFAGDCTFVEGVVIRVYDPTFAEKCEHYKSWISEEE